MDLDSLDSYTETVVTQEMPDGRVLEWRVVPISPSDGARAGVGLSAVQAAVMQAGASGGSLGGVQGDAPKRDVSLQDLADLGEYTDRLCMCGVRGLRDQGEKVWTPIRLAVEANKRQNPVRLPVALLHQGQTPDGGSVLEAVAAAAAAAMKGAAARAATFRSSE